MKFVFLRIIDFGLGFVVFVRKACFHSVASRDCRRLLEFGPSLWDFGGTGEPWRGWQYIRQAVSTPAYMSVRVCPSVAASQ